MGRSVPCRYVLTALEFDRQRPAVIGPAVTTHRPSGLNSASLTTLAWPTRRSSGSPVLASQIRLSPSSLEVTRRSPERSKCTEVIGFLWPASSVTVPVFRSSRKTLPPLSVARLPPASATGGGCSRGLAWGTTLIHGAASGSQRRRVPSRLPV